MGQIDKAYPDGGAASSPTTTKGDLIVRGASADERLAVGTDGQVPTADAASPGGIKWDDPAAGGGGAARKGCYIEDSESDPHGAGFQTLTFDTEVYDDDGFATLGTNNDRLTVPTGITRVNVSAYIEMSAVAGGTGNRFSIRHFNSSDVLQKEIAGHSADHFYDTPRISATALGVEVVAGDYFEVQSIFEDGTTTIEYRSFSIQDALASGAVGPVGPAGGQTRRYNNQQTDLSTAPSTSSNATKGQWIDVKTNVTVHDVGAGMRTDNNADHYMFIAKEAATPFEVDSIIATSEDSGPSDIVMTASGLMHFQFAAPVVLLAGEKYFFGIVRSDGITTTSANIIFANGSRLPHPDFAAAEIGLYANNVNPAPGFDIGSGGTNNTVPIEITYVRT